MGYRCKSPRHLQRKADVDSERKARACAKERASNRIENRGIDESLVRTKIVAGQSKVVLQDGFGEGPYGFRGERLGFATKKDAPTDLMFLCQFAGDQIVSCREYPGTPGDGGGVVRQEAERAFSRLRDHVG